MKLEDGGRYPARVEGARLTTSDNGSDGIAMRFNCGEHGGISHTIYLTPARLEYAERELNNLGIDSKKLRSDEFWDNIGQWLEGAECEIVIGEEEYQGKKRLKVKFINPVAKPARAGAPARLAGLFGGRSSTQTYADDYATAAHDHDAPPPRGMRY